MTPDRCAVCGRPLDLPVAPDDPDDLLCEECAWFDLDDGEEAA
jgi:hypothetical protein